MRKPPRELLRRLAWLGVAASALVVSACSSPALAPPAATLQANPLASLWQDALFAPPSQPVPTQPGQALFDMSPAMVAYAASAPPLADKAGDVRRALIQALYQRQELRLRYDDSRTRTAHEAFADRAGNCLSLVVMTAAFAKHLGLPVSYQQVAVEDSYSRRGGLDLSSSHINLLMARPTSWASGGRAAFSDLVVDFLPGAELGYRRAAPLAEHTVVAMYLNNRAAELLIEGQAVDAYWWAKAAVQHDPLFAPATNTLALVYLRQQLLAAAEHTLQRVLQQDANNITAWGNLAATWARQGRVAEAAQASARLAQLQPQAPFAQYDLGRQALQAGDASRAQQHFAQELRLQPLQHEVHFWAAVASWQLGQLAGAHQHLVQARDNSPNAAAEQRYASKLAALRAPQAATRPQSAPAP
jgi:predicted Zn-dependent protease